MKAWLSSSSVPFFWTSRPKNPQNFCFPSAPATLYTFFVRRAETPRRLKTHTDKGHPARKLRSAKPLTYTHADGGGRTDAAVAEVMPERDENTTGRRRARRSTRPGLAVFSAREKHCGRTTYGRDLAARRESRRSNWDAPADILDWHVAAIIIPFRSRGPVR